MAKTVEAPTPEARIAELEAKNQQLADEILHLRNQELKLHKYQDVLDRQFRLYRQLYEVGKKFNSTIALPEILAHAMHSVLYDFRFERACILLREPDGAAFRVRSFEGYYDEAAAAALAEPRLEAGAPAMAGLAAGPVVCPEGSTDDALLAIGSAFGMGEFVLLALGRNASDAAGILIAGNTSAQAKHHSRVQADSEMIMGLANLASQAATAIANANFYDALEQERRLLEMKVEERTHELSQAMEGLQKLDQMKTQFFANVSHELRTPLTLSTGPIEMLLRNEALDAGTRRHLVTVHDNQLRLLRLINDLLDFAKLEAGKLSARYRPDDLGRALRYYVGMLDAAAASRRIQLAITGPDHPVEVYVDRDQFEKIVMNLLSNAFKFTPDGGAITVELEERSADVLVHVRDSGIGIPADALDTVFERFSQVDSSDKRAYSGTGIGLALVKELIEMHGGEVTVRSVLGQGSTFTLRLLRGRDHLSADAVHETLAGEVEVRPEFLVELRASEADADPLEAEGGAEEARDDEAGDEDPDAAALEHVYRTDHAGGATARRPTVVVVDDTAEMRQFVASLLRPDYRVYTAGDGLAGLELARRVMPDLVLSDVMMPRMSGHELCQAIKSSRGRLGRVPVLLCTARADMSMKLEGFEHGADDYLVKPFNPDELASRVRNLVRMRRQEDELLRAFRALATKDMLLQEDLARACVFQQSMLPRARIDDGALRVASTYLPAAVVGGDLFDVTVTEPGRMRVFAADATGHGVQAAFRTMIIKAEYERWKGVAEPEAVLTRLNQRIADAYRGDMHFTACCVDLREDSGVTVVRCANAGLPPPVVASRTDIQFLPAEASQPIGFGAPLQLGVVDARLEPGDRLLLHTDGVIDERDPAGRPFGLRRLLASVRRHRQDELGRLVAAVAADVDHFRGPGRSPLDDRLLVAIERKRADGRVEAT